MKEPSIGELRTPVVFKSVSMTPNKNGVEIPTESTVLSTKCRWVGAHGDEAVQNMRLNLVETATISIRYSSLVNEKQRVYEGPDTSPWDVVSIDDIRKRHKWMEIALKRTVKA